jgi:hypothetical protein
VSLIELEPVLITLTESILTFTELRRVLDSLPHALTSWALRYEWIRNQESIQKLIDRVQQQKGSLSLVLNVMQWSVDEV